LVINNIKTLIVFALIISSSAIACNDPVYPGCSTCSSTGVGSDTVQCQTVNVPESGDCWSCFFGNCDPSCVQAYTTRNYEVRYLTSFDTSFNLFGNGIFSQVELPIGLWGTYPIGTTSLGYTKSVSLPLGEDQRLGGKGHTRQIPKAVSCAPSKANNGMVCDNAYLGEAFGHVIESRMKVYGPNGRIFWMKVRQGVGRY